jgi:murein DD-endopeptidase MepM/ murein hydrolase activator NlpD
VTDPGAGSATPVPPSASAPLPEPAPPAREAAVAAEEARPPSPALSEQRTEASRTQFIMPVDGRVIRAFAPGRSDGIDIAARTGADVKAAAAGTVAAITTDTNQVVVVVIRHDDGLMSIYAQMDALTVSRGARVSQGQKIGQVAAADPSFLRFEIRTSDLSPVDPMRYLQ